MTVDSNSLNRRKFPLYGTLGLLIIILGEVLLFFDISPVGVYFTPLQWTGYILCVDGVIYFLSGRSIITTRRREFLVMLPWSVLCWGIFEVYNLHLRNWTYVGLPENWTARWIGYIWSFATIFPAIFETADALQLLLPDKPMRSLRISKGLLLILSVTGLLFLAVPLVLPQDIAGKLFAFIWIGFLLLLDPFNHILGGASLLKDLAEGRFARVISLALSGILCGILWEFWNYWAVAKWVYSVPISFVGPKIFEMPLLGFLGFIPFALECFAMHQILLSLVPSLTRSSATGDL